MGTIFWADLDKGLCFLPALHDGAEFAGYYPAIMGGE